jgi:hypothetical protein
MNETMAVSAMNCKNSTGSDQAPQKSGQTQTVDGALMAEGGRRSPGRLRGGENFAKNCMAPAVTLPAARA